MFDLPTKKCHMSQLGFPHLNRNVRGPLDVLREHWDSDTKGEESAVSYVLLMRHAET